MAPPAAGHRAAFGPLRFLYVGSQDVPRDLAHYTTSLGGKKVWHFRAFGAEVAAVRLGEGPLVLLADHRPAPSCLPIWEVADLEATQRDLAARGWRQEGPAFEIPNGPCVLWHDPSGNPLAVFQDARPAAMEGAYAEQGNENAVR